MKKFIKTLLPGALALAFVAAPALVPTASAQDTTAAAPAAANQDEKARLDKQFRDNFRTNKPVAYQAAKDYVAKFSSDAESAEFVKYLQGWIPKYEAEVKAAEAAKIGDPCVNALKAKNNAEVFARCQAWLAAQPENAYPLIVPIDYGFGLATANPAVNTYNDQTIALAKQAIQKIEANQIGDVKWADYNYKSKEDALAWMNYIIGFITFNNMTGKEAESVPYFYKALGYNSEIKAKWLPYYALGFNYRTQYNKGVQEFQQKSAGATELTQELKDLVGRNNAIADRAIDAFARSYDAANKDTKATATLKAARRKDLEEVYKARNKGATAGLDAVIAGVASKPMPDPASPITPVYDTETTATGASSSAGTTLESTNNAASTNGSAETRPRTANGTDAATTTTKTATTTAATKTTTTAKPAAKPAPKKAVKKPSR